ncbi:hypothetical protein [Sphingomonas immobilis]|uniref:PH domain-containing protein n=1 Tax=Sphingomonas immobilis TaxID=3063997 RepID=A0ABT9A2B3_9SPHN|nr:hypothetical protein [Sphingomonas sp. CA1-15]MDO7842857.1 hypothetical protein [Sphingomonas sp. CA1-15]
MPQQVDTATFEASRLKNVPALPLIAALMVLYLKVFRHRGVDSLYRFGILFHMRPLLLFPIAVLLAAACYALIKIAKPDRLMLSSNGWTVKSVFSSSSYDWDHYGEPRKGWLATGYGGEEVIRLQSLSGGKDAVIFARAFQNDFDEILRAVGWAREGRLPAPQEGNFPLGYVVGYFPVSFGILAAAVAWLFYGKP